MSLISFEVNERLENDGGNNRKRLSMYDIGRMQMFRRMK